MSKTTSLSAAYDGCKFFLNHDEIRKEFFGGYVILPDGTRKDLTLKKPWKWSKSNKGRLLAELHKLVPAVSLSARLREECKAVKERAQQGIIDFLEGYGLTEIRTSTLSSTPVIINNCDDNDTYTLDAVRLRGNCVVLDCSSCCDDTSVPDADVDILIDVLECLEENEEELVEETIDEWFSDLEGKDLDRAFPDLRKEGMDENDFIDACDDFWSEQDFKGRKELYMHFVGLFPKK